MDQSDIYDEECLKQFSHILAVIYSQKPTTDQILEAAKPCSATFWMNLIILLDQLTRNCYRGKEAAQVFDFIDPLAPSIVMTARRLNIHEMLEVRWKLGYRIWLFTPSIHAVDLKMQEIMVEEHRARFEDLQELVQGDGEGRYEGEKECRRVLEEEAQRLSDVKVIFDRATKNHFVAIERFGRLPWRNESLGRVTTEEEQEFLESL
ncbi:hypothetical protein AUEXF2481DRAFT_39772 [Aureobasidium subglaciale EXF-2481]|uniref:Uncharacterized protein n=1 Tax=Aureobasidium subglaciale (strain EXF-2481) TaxID=1043005 RepID=A0A074YGR2_AURSE|nr:uncharacterized protein AUEXF2481DRAFT_39772 [Aureobasidium subglaciale EXF-2481]KAI5194433.1 hypothetical protein E4T38_09587 [Aureobasidium subglaciale]KAI5213692.1 hypothetical protein E4T40_09525 [Aureobasidium subglaciale]KAI5215539.1 hypothetical protein E4T41_09563 [Aureobasidium subglaciale]KAI5253368.1 hypothetical protein E4T46_09521 [Aureobasidium subglaciale]KEQ95239.1 hypothetical protein AUEXF2481DRAFT_39772 [Aureobasidium subglaciale EXF-2481]